jgi:hypothetical protein
MNLPTYFTGARRWLWTLSVVLALAPTPVSGAVVFDNGEPFTGGSFAKSDSVAFPQWMADDFTFPSDVTVQGVRFWGAWNFFVPSTTDFEVVFYRDSPGPENVFAVVTVGNLAGVSTGLSYSGWELREFRAAFDPIAFEAGRTYWIAIYDKTVENSSQYFLWKIITSNDSPLAARSIDLGESWSPFPAGMAFQLEGPTAETLTYELRGRVDFIVDLSGGAGVTGFFNPGDTFTARLTYDPRTPGSASEFTATYPGAVKWFTFSYSNGFAGGAAGGTVRVWNNFPLGINNQPADVFFAESPDAAAPMIGNARLVNLNTFVADYSGVVFPSLDLIPLPALSNFGGTHFETIYQNAAGGTSYVVGRIMSLARAPDSAPPTANAGPDQSVHAGRLVTLDGSQSFDDNTASQELVFSWGLTTRPDGSAATLAGADTASPTFTVDVPGTYVATLTVTDSDGLTSAPDTVVLASLNAAPTARVGGDQAAIVGQTVRLDATASTDMDGDPLIFEWTLQVPAGSGANLVAPTSATPSFVPDVRGTYTAMLTVRDPYDAQDVATIHISAITAQDFIENEIAESQNLVGALPPTSVTTPGNQNALQQFLRQVIESIQASDQATARGKLEQAISRTDGCVLRGTPDVSGAGRDWVTNCMAQAELYDHLTTALHALEP